MGDGERGRVRKQGQGTLARAIWLLIECMPYAAPSHQRECDIPAASRVVSERLRAQCCMLWLLWLVFAFRSSRRHLWKPASCLGHDAPLNIQGCSQSMSDRFWSAAGFSNVAQWQGLLHSLGSA